MTEALAASPLVRAVALALVEFVWQGAAVGLAVALVLFALRRASAQMRYVVACLGLAAMAIAPVLTAAAYFEDGAGPTRASVIRTGISRTTSAGPAADSADARMLQPEPRDPFRGWLEPRLPLVILIWSVGVLLMAAHMFVGWIRVRRIRRTATPLEPRRWPERVRVLAGRCRVTRRVRLLVSSLVDVPAVIGFVRPAILVPASALSGLSADFLEAILLHELAHVRRRDYLVNVVQCVVEVLLFYHPAVWWVSQQIRREREHCCDDFAASRCADQVTYARALTSLEELRIPATRLAVGAAGGDLLARIRRLIAPETVTHERLSGGFAMSVVFTLALLALTLPIGSLSLAAEPPPEQTTVLPAPAVQPAPAASSSTAQPASPRAAATPRPAPSIVPRASAAVPANPAEIAPVAPQAQTGTASLAGVVRDQTGAVIPGVNVALTRSTSEPARTGTTDARGEFAIGDLAAGTYELTVSQRGFRTGRSTVDLMAGQDRRIDVLLNVGSLTETVTVSSPASSGRAGTAVRQPPVNPQTAADYFDAARAYYEQGQFAVATNMTQRAIELLRSAAPETGLTGSPASQPPVAAGSPAAPLRVGGNIMAPRKIRHVPPIYPADAFAAGVEGVVVIEAIIGTDGTVRDATVVKSVPMLEEAALGAVRLWQFTPTKLNGVPIEVVMTVAVNFSR